MHSLTLAIDRMMNELSNEDWLRQIEDLGEAEGYFEPLGAQHSALFVDRGPVLLVSFENRAAIRSREVSQLPFGLSATEAAGHSSLTLIANGDTWYRDPAIYSYFDRLVDEAFFEDFDRVVFYGVGPGGYAAAAYSVVAPGAQVIAIQPQATLEPLRAGWDDRFTHMRRTSFSDRYGYAPDMLEGAAAAWIIYDPLEQLDAMHASLMLRPHVTPLRCRYLGGAVEPILTQMNLTKQMLLLACEGRFDATAFWKLYRARRAAPTYMRQILGRLASEGQTLREALVCRNMADRMNAPRYGRRLETLKENLAEQGIALPPRLSPGTRVRA